MLLSLVMWRIFEGNTLGNKGWDLNYLLRSNWHFFYVFLNKTIFVTYF